MKLLSGILILLLPSLQGAVASNIGGTRQDIVLTGDGGYGNILVAIDNAVPEDPRLLDRLKEYFTGASTFMLKATEGQVYFSNVTILVPNTWTFKHACTWEAVKDETFDQARVLIAPSNKAWGHTPYTLQPGQCGEEGDYIHITPEYLVNEAVREGSKPGKRLVREFAHLKWGLFDEDVSVTDNVSPRFYMEDGGLVPTTCSKSSFFGLIRNLRTGGECDYEDLKTEDCELVPTYVDTNSSIMYKDHLDGVTMFCTKHSHNREAPNRQNRLCGGRSAWEIMEQLPDFAVDCKAARSGRIPPDTTFRIVQEVRPAQSNLETTTADVRSITTIPTKNRQEERDVSVTECPQDIVCLALDVSGSMHDYQRVDKMRDAMAIYIQERLRSGTAVGIVSFRSSAYVLANMTVVTGALQKEWLTSCLPRTAGGGTSISSGLKACKQLLHSYAGSNVDKTRILLITDGEDSGAMSGLPRIKELGITVDSLLYGQDADKDAIQIADETGGKRFFVDDLDSETELNQAMIDTVERGCVETSSSIINKKIRLPSTQASFNDMIPIDWTLGVNTTLLFSYSGSDDFDVVVMCSTGNIVTVTRNSQSKLVKAVVDGIVSGNVINYLITKKYVRDVLDMVVSVTSKPCPGKQPINIQTRVNEENINFNQNTTLNIYTDIFQGLTPVLNLTVLTIVKTASGIEKILLSVDDGTGMDSTPNDGVYTSSLSSHEFRGNGYYSIQIKTDGDGLVPNNNDNKDFGSPSEPGSYSNLGRIVRTKSAGVVTVVNYNCPVPDTTPPEQIKDLTVSLQYIGENQNIFTLKWTAPGNDLNIGRACAYNLYVSNDSTLNHLIPIPRDHGCILTNLRSLLVDAGIKLQLEINLGELQSGGLAGVGRNWPTYYIRMTAEDDLGNVGDYSNPVALTLVDPKSLYLMQPSTTTTTPAMEQLSNATRKVCGCFIYEV